MVEVEEQADVIQNIQRKDPYQRDEGVTSTIKVPRGYFKNEEDERH